MNTTELSKDTRVEVVKGLWKGFEGVVEDVHEESSVIRVVNSSGEAAYAFKDDVQPL